MTIAERGRQIELVTLNFDLLRTAYDTLHAPVQLSLKIVPLYDFIVWTLCGVLTNLDTNVMLSTSKLVPL